jgi:hypothetical protein
MYSRIIPNETLAVIFGFLSSHDRANVCSVSHQFEAVALQVSIATSVFPQGYSQQQLPFGYLVGDCNIIHKKVQKTGEIHLLHRLRPEHLDARLVCQGGAFHLLPFMDNVNYDEAIAGALKGGHVAKAMELTEKHKHSVIYSCINAACRLGDLEILKQLHNGYRRTSDPFGWKAIKSAYKAKSLPIVQYLLPILTARRSVEDHLIVQYAYQYGSRKIIDFVTSALLPKMGENIWNHGLCGAVCAGNIQLAQEMIDKGAKYSREFIYEAIRYGAADGLKTILGTCRDISRVYLYGGMLYACDQKRLSMMRILHEHGAKIDPDCIYKFLVDNSDFADGLEFILSAVPTFDFQRALRRAARSNDLPCFKHLISKCDPSLIDFEQILAKACVADSDAISDYILDNFYKADPLALLTAAYKSNNFHQAFFLYRTCRVPGYKVFAQAILFECSEVTRYFVDSALPYAEIVLIECLFTNNLEHVPTALALDLDKDVLDEALAVAHKVCPEMIGCLVDAGAHERPQ